MNDFKIGDAILTTRATSTGTAAGAVGVIGIIVSLDHRTYTALPYRIVYNDELRWVDGVAPSSLIKELM
jgi:hypothetical protein